MEHLASAGLLPAATEFARASAGEVEPLPPIHDPLIAEIQAALCLRFEITRAELLSERRVRDVARPRQIGMYLARKLTHHSCSSIGRRFGKRDHTTVLHAIKAVERLRRSEAGFAVTIDDLCRSIAVVAALRGQAAA